MTDQPIQPEQPKKETPAAPPANEETKKSTQPLNTNTGANSKPLSKIDQETEELIKKMLSNRKQAAETTSAAGKAGPAPSSQTPLIARKPVTPEAENPGEKVAWPQPAKALGGSAPAAKPAAVSTPAEAPKPAAPAASMPAAPVPSAPAPTPPPVSTPTAPTTGTARLNRPPADPVRDVVPEEPKPSGAGTGLLRRAKIDAQAAIRTTGATRKVPKGMVAQEVWKVIFQAMVGAQVKELTVEVKGLSIVGRADPDGKSKADFDLTPFNAGDYGVSRQHVILVPTEEGPCIIDMNSTNGTWINGLYLEPGRRYRLRTNDRVELGSLKLLVRVMTPAEQKVPAPSSES